MIRQVQPHSLTSSLADLLTIYVGNGLGNIVHHQAASSLTARLQAEMYL